MNCLGYISPTACALKFDEIQNLQKVGLKINVTGDVFVSPIAIKNRTHMQIEIFVLREGISDHFLEFDLQKINFVAHAACSVDNDSDIDSCRDCAWSTYF